LESNDNEPTPAQPADQPPAPVNIQARQPEVRNNENGVHFRSPLQIAARAASGAQSSSSFHPSSDENDDESMIIFSNPNNNNGNGRNSSRVGTADPPGCNGCNSLASSSTSMSFCGIVTRPPGESSENGNSSSGTEYTVDDCSDGDDLWADELSSSEDEEDGNRRPRPRRNGRAIGVPLLL